MKLSSKLNHWELRATNNRATITSPEGEKTVIEIKGLTEKEWIEVFMARFAELSKRSKKNGI